MSCSPQTLTLTDILIMYLVGTHLDQFISVCNTSVMLAKIKESWAALSWFLESQMGKGHLHSIFMEYSLRDTSN